MSQDRSISTRKRQLGIQLLQAVAILIGVIAYANARAYFHWPRMPLPWVAGAAILATDVHELGHYLAARCFGIPVRKLVLGSGRKLLRIRAGETELELRVLPVSGFILPYPYLRAERGPMLAMLAGGCLANLTVAALIVGAKRAGIVPDGWSAALHAVLAFQLIDGVANLIPFRSGTGGMDSDGLHIWRWMQKDALAAPNQATESYRRALHHYAVDAGDRPFVPTAASARVYNHLATRLPDGQDGSAELQLELDGGQLSTAETLLVLDTLITRALMTREPNLVRHLDAWSARALALAPDLRTIQGSRGAALVELGRIEEGRAMLAAIAAASTGFDAFMTKLFLANAELARGDLAAARRWAEAAVEEARDRRDAPAVAVLLPRLEADLAKAGAQA